MADENEAADGDDVAGGKVKHRSPNYPLFDLAKAVESQGGCPSTRCTRCRLELPMIAGATRKLTAGNQAVGTMKSYGLISVERRSGEKRLITITDAGRRNRIKHAGAVQPHQRGRSRAGLLFRSLWERSGLTDSRRMMF